MLNVFHKQTPWGGHCPLGPLRSAATVLPGNLLWKRQQGEVLCPENLLPSELGDTLQAYTYLGRGGEWQHPQVCQWSTRLAVNGNWTSQVTLDVQQSHRWASLLCILWVNPSQTPLQKHVGLGALGWVAGVTHIMYGVLTAPPAPRPVPTRWKETFNLGKWTDHSCPVSCSLSSWM